MTAAVAVSHPAGDAEIFQNVGGHIGVCDNREYDNDTRNGSTEKNAVHNLLLLVFIISKSRKRDCHNRHIGYTGNRLQICRQADRAETKAVEDMQAEDKSNESREKMA